jgi:threonine/homoserine/homoserine lactone efflux protein
MADPGLEFLQVAVAHLLAVASPGPDFAIVLRQSVTHGRRAGLATSAGIGVAIGIHVTYSISGLALLGQGSAQGLALVQYAGAGYLAWLGLQCLRAGPVTVTPELSTPAAGVSDRGAFATGFLTCVLNPKAALFFVALFLLGVDPATPRWLQAGYGLWMAAVTFGWFCLVATLFTRPALRVRFLRLGPWLDRSLGVIFLVLAGSLAFAHLR